MLSCARVAGGHSCYTGRELPQWRQHTPTGQCSSNGSRLRGCCLWGRRGSGASSTARGDSEGRVDVGYTMPPPPLEWREDGEELGDSWKEARCTNSRPGPTDVPQWCSEGVTGRPWLSSSPACSWRWACAGAASSRWNSSDNCDVNNGSGVSAAVDPCPGAPVAA